MNFKKSIFYIFLNIFILSQSFAEDIKNKDLKIFAGKWVTNCSNASTNNQKLCILQRSMFIDKDLKKKLVTIVIQTKSSTDDIQFTLISPLGTLIKAGVKINFDESPLNKNAFAFNICQKIGCITSMTFEKKILKKFNKAKSLNLEYKTVDKQKISIKVSLAGFSKAYKNLN